MSALRASRGQLAALAGLLVVAIATLGLAVTLSGPGGGGPSQTALPQEQETAPSADLATELDPVDYSVSTYEVFLARDPFEPVVPEPVDGNDGTNDGSTDGGTESPTTSPTVGPGTDPTGPTDPTDPTDPTGPTDPGDPDSDPSGTESPSDPSCRQGATVVCDGHTVKLIDVFEKDGSPRAVVQVDQTVYEVGVGETFATNFRVRSIEDSCATLLYGDDGFTLCEGESVRK